MDQADINRRCVELLQHPDVRHHLWHPRMFWDVGMKDNPDPADLTRPKVDLAELEFLLASAAHQPSQCLAEMEARHPGRAWLITHMLERGDMPLLDRPAD